MIDFNGNEPPKNMNKLSVESKKKLINYDKQLLQIFNKYVNNKIIQ